MTDKEIGSEFDCGWQDWLHDRACDPHMIENGVRHDNLTPDQMLEYIRGWNEAKTFYRETRKGQS